MNTDLQFNIDELKDTFEGWPASDKEVIRVLIASAVDLSTLFSTQTFDAADEIEKYPLLDKYKYSNYNKIAEFLNIPLIDPGPEGHGYDPPPMIGNFGAIQLIEYYNDEVRSYRRSIRNWNMNVLGNPAAIRNGLISIPIIPPVVFKQKYGRSDNLIFTTAGTKKPFQINKIMYPNDIKDGWDTKII